MKMCDACLYEPGYLGGGGKRLLICYSCALNQTEKDVNVIEAINQLRNRGTIETGNDYNDSHAYTIRSAGNRG
jgi:hypothetical protein